MPLSKLNYVVHVGCAVLGGAARVGRRSSTPQGGQAKFIAGVPVLNAHLASVGGAAEAEGDAHSDWVLVFGADARDADLEAACKLRSCLRVGHPSAGGVPYMEVRGTESDVAAVLAATSARAEFVEPDAAVHAVPEVGSEEKVELKASWGLERIGAPKRANEGAGVHVYVLDTGIRVSHQEFQGRAVPGLDISSGTGVECNGDVQCAGDVQGHGTHCAGTAVGRMYGVAPAAQTHAVKVLSDSGSGQFAWSYEGLDWIATRGSRPAVASMSLGGRVVLSGMKTAVDAAVAAGVTVVVAAGNENSNACGGSPAFVPSAITVGAIMIYDYRATFSNYGECVDMWAPGDVIPSADSRDDSSFRDLSGTSMACPHVSGAAALLLESDPSLTPAGVMNKLYDTAANGFLRNPRLGDTNSLLYVGADGAPLPPTPAPTPAPPPSPCTPLNATGPNWKGDCQCNSGLICYQGGRRQCTSLTYPRFPSSWYFDKACTNCECRQS